MRSGRAYRLVLLLGAAAAAAALGFHLSGARARDRRERPATPVVLAGRSPARLTARSNRLHHYEYVFPDRNMLVYDIDNDHRLVEHVRFPQGVGIRGVAVSPRRHLLFVSYGGDGGENGSGSMLAYDLVRGRLRWQWSYKSGIDSPAVSADGRWIFLPP